MLGVHRFNFGNGFSSRKKRGNDRPGARAGDHVEDIAEDEIVPPRFLPEQLFNSTKNLQRKNAADTPAVKRKDAIHGVSPEDTIRPRDKTTK
jgi:hypothetical protein